eukprot:m.45460 g.45460  ORF g.45460 m.45460 type:complete len:357 (-) comp10246_c0_seq1:379-1449(-)
MFARLQSVKDFCKRHKWKVTAAVVTAGGYAAVKLLEWKVQELEEKEEAEHREFARRKILFDGNEAVGNEAVVKMMPEMYKPLDNIVGNVKSMIDELKRMRSAEGSEKESIYRQKWEELKNVVFTEVVVAVYVVSLLVVFIRVQVNILGGTMYANPDKEGTDAKTEYLKQSKFLQKNGIEKLVSEIKPRASAVLAKYKVGETTMSRVKLSQCLNEIKNSFEADSSGKLRTYQEFLFPQQSQAPNASRSSDLDILMFETKDVVDSKPFRDTLAACVNTCLRHVEDDMAMLMMKHAHQEPDPNAEVPLPLVIPKLYRENKAIFSLERGPLKLLLELPELSDLSARVFESFCEEDDLQGA